MNKVLYIAAAGIFLASCGSNQNTANNQRTIDSMQEAMVRQHIIDSMNAAGAAAVPAPGASPVAAPAHERRERHEYYSHERQGTYTGNAPVNNAPVVTPAPVVVTPPPAPPAPSAADIAAEKKAEKKKELKSAAEGALIGAGAGALGGAVVGKNNKYKGQDAAIGGGVGAVLGAGAGLLLEKRKLKRDSTRH